MSAPFVVEEISHDLLSRVGFRLPKPIVTPDVTHPSSPSGWPSRKQCRSAKGAEALSAAMLCAKKALQAYPPGETPPELEDRLERLLNRVFREQRPPDSRGRPRSKHPALPSMRAGRLPSIPPEKIPPYRVHEVRVYSRTDTQTAFLNIMRFVLDYESERAKRNAVH